MESAGSRTVTELFLRQATNRLRHDYMSKIRRCLDRLTDAEVWWRPNEKTNSIGNILLHLAGNLRQWVVSGLGGAADTRTRDVEFSTLDGIGKAELLSRLDAVVAAAEDVICRLSEAELTSDRAVQGYRATGLSAVFHAVEHFSGHTGQVIWITKMLKGEDLRFYEL
jgi:uncharacterized damage-inducible protein DinB